MLEVLTNSGIVLSVDEASPHRETMLSVAADALGGIVAQSEIEEDAAQAIINQRTIGTVLTDGQGDTFHLLPEGWVNAVGVPISSPLPETIASATLPGGWSWVR